MKHILLVDDARSFADLVAKELEAALGYEVSVVADPSFITRRYLEDQAFACALVDLSFPTTDLSGLDVLMALTRYSPETRLVIVTQGDSWVAELLRISWEAVPVATAVSKTASVEAIISMIRSVITSGTAPVDPVLAPLLPAERSPHRAATAFRRLVRHRGHAKLWNALIEADAEPSYADLRAATGLKINTIRNYREQIVADLALHDLHNPTMHEIYDFAQVARPLLRPVIEPYLAVEDAGR